MRVTQSGIFSTQELSFLHTLHPQQNLKYLQTGGSQHDMHDTMSLICAVKSITSIPTIILQINLKGAYEIELKRRKDTETTNSVNVLMSSYVVVSFSISTAPFLVLTPTFSLGKNERKILGIQ